MAGRRLAGRRLGGRPREDELGVALGQALLDDGEVPVPFTGIADRAPIERALAA